MSRAEQTLASWGRNIEAARLRLGISREHLARRVGVSPPTVWRWETGAMAPNVKRLFQLADVFDTPASDLFPLNDPESYVPL